MSTTKRTKIDFSKHILEVEKTDKIAVYSFRLPEKKHYHSVIVICACGVTTITGDWGNWVFCREFHPCKNGKVSEGYWDEKLEIGSVQKSDVFDEDEAIREIDALLKENDDFDDETIMFLNDLRGWTSDEFEYVQFIRDNKPQDGPLDYTDLPTGRIRHRWLDAIYDAFDVMCDLIEKQ